jgi:hypothetical protein
VDILIKNTAIDKKESLPGQQVIIILLLNKLRGLKAGPLCEEPVRGNIFRRKDYLDRIFHPIVFRVCGKLSQ